MSSRLVDARFARQVAGYLVDCGAFAVDLGLPRSAWFRWKSGITAPCGCDCRRLNAFPEQRGLIADALAAAVRDAFPGVDYVVGVAQAGIPWATSLAERLSLPLAYVRTQPRAAGGPRVECAPRGRGRAVLVEDVVASGASARAAIQAIGAETELTVAGVQSIANWDFPEARTALAGRRVRALTSYPYLLNHARGAGLIDDAGLALLTGFYHDPRNYTWDGHFPADEHLPAD